MTRYLRIHVHRDSTILLLAYTNRAVDEICSRLVEAQFDFLTEQTFVEDGAIIDRKLNVVMTRARRHLFMTGNATLLRTVPLFARLLDFVNGKGCYFGKIQTD